MQTRSSVLGKRHASATIDLSPSSSTVCDAAQAPLPLTPDTTPNPKRIKVCASIPDGGDANKENVPPFRGGTNEGSPSARSARRLRRSATEFISPARTRTGLRRHASTATISTVTPSTALLHLSIATPPPTPPTTLLPICARARALLRATCNSKSEIAGRDVERGVIRNFIASIMSAPDGQNSQPTLYISGSPGTGKTALVNSVLQHMHDELKTADTKVLFVNCMALNSIDALWDKLLEELNERVHDGRRGGKSRKLKESSFQTLERMLAEQLSKCVIVLDELDHIASSTQSLTSLFTLCQTYSTRIRLIGIANTHTLTSATTTTHSAQALASVQTLHFSPYTPQQLLQILQARLVPLYDIPITSSRERADQFLPLPTLILLTKKIAAQTGDVRAIFEVLRGAIDIAVNSSTNSNPLEAPTPPVSPSHILSALKAYAPSRPSLVPTAQSTARKASDSEVVTKVRDLGLQHRLVVLGLLLARKRLDVGLALSTSPVTTPCSTPRSPVKRSQSTNAISTAAGIDVTQLHSYYKAALTRSNGSVFTPVSRSEFGDLLNMLETVGLVLLTSNSGLPGTPSKSGKRGLGRTHSSGSGLQLVKFVEGVRLEEISRGLGISEDVKGTEVDVREEEVRAIWERERVKTLREVKARGDSASKQETFTEAFED